MEEALRREMRRRRERARRRAFLASTAGIVTAGAAGLWFGWEWFGFSKGSSHDELAEARRLARAPLFELVAHYVEVLDALDLHGGDAELWLGVRRLGRWALAESGEEARGRVAWQIELTLAAQRRLPEDLAGLVAEIRRRRKGSEEGK